jgi:hypothetical protein
MVLDTTFIIAVILEKLLISRILQEDLANCGDNPFH